MSATTRSMRNDDLIIDPSVELVRLDLSSGGCPARLARLRMELRSDSDRGWCKILYEDDAIAVVQWVDEFVLTITPAGMAMASAIMSEGGDS